MKALTKLRRLLCVVIAFALVVNTVNVNSLTASATQEVTEQTDSEAEADESVDDETIEEADSSDSDEQSDDTETDDSTASEETAEAEEESDDAASEEESDEDIQTTEEETEDADEEETSSANSLMSAASDNAGSASSGNEVTVSAELSSGIPSDAELVVETADQETVLNAIDLEGATTTLYYAMSIHLEADGAEYELTDNQTVTLTFENLTLDADAIADMWFFHIHDDGDLDDRSFANAEYYSDFSYTDNGDGTYDVTYTTSSFSDFVIASQSYEVETVADEATYDYEINIGNSSLSSSDGYTYTSTGKVVTLTGEGKSYRIYRDSSLSTTYAYRFVLAANNISVYLDGVELTLSSSNAAISVNAGYTGEYIYFMDGSTIAVTGNATALSLSSPTTVVIDESGSTISSASSTAVSIASGAELTIQGEGNLTMSSNSSTAVSIASGAQFTA